ncbi:hypothetical protein AMTRI_Chr12g236290 [Amborella trichopoda]
MRTISPHLLHPHLSRSLASTLLQLIAATLFAPLSSPLLSPPPPCCVHLHLHPTTFFPSTFASSIVSCFPPFAIFHFLSLENPQDEKKPQTKSIPTFRLFFFRLEVFVSCVFSFPFNSSSKPPSTSTQYTIFSHSLKTTRFFICTSHPLKTQRQILSLN